ncbi:MAG: A24 family peptidase [Woeseiaceae bacterium]|jgi:leader peptidase (prepilin peptidase)/N-methyltransferase|nr:A24 family peptidase [Woeseiaceae bacterium]
MQALLIESPLTFIAAAFILALLVGSFLNVVIHRLPLMMEREWRTQCAELAAEPAKELPEGRFDVMAPRSRCPQCGHQITALENIPIVSYLMLSGKCSGCSAKISARYPAVELLTAILTGVVAWHFGFGWEAAAGIGLTWMLVAISVIDIDHQLIPDSMSLPLLWAGLSLSLFHPLDGAQTLFIEPQTAIAGALAGYLSLWSVYQLFRIITGKEGMGYGDFKLLAALGAILGWKLLPVIIMMSAIVGAVIGIMLIVTKQHERSVPIPFGPYLAAAGWIAMLWGSDIVNWYLDFMG